MSQSDHGQRQLSTDFLWEIETMFHFFEDRREVKSSEVLGVCDRVGMFRKVFVSYDENANWKRAVC